MHFEPDYRNILAVAGNTKPPRLPLYEHIIAVEKMEEILEKPFGNLITGDDADVGEFFRIFCDFFRQMTYDTVSYEYCITNAICGGKESLIGQKPGPIQNRTDFEKFDWQQVEETFWQNSEKLFQGLKNALPPGMKAIGGVGNGVFEISESLVGLENLAYMQIDDPELFSDLYVKIGDLMASIWKRFLKSYSECYVVCRFGDDLGFRSGTLTTPGNIRKHIIPQYKRVVELIHEFQKPFLWHSCGCIFEIMQDVINNADIDAKHSNEDSIAPFDNWIEGYSDQIGLFGGIDVDILCQWAPADIKTKVVEDGSRFREKARGFALGSGNSIPEYVPAKGYLAMIDAVKEIRSKENND